MANSSEANRCKTLKSFSENNIITWCKVEKNVFSSCHKRETRKKFWVPLRNRTPELRIFHKSFKLQTWIKIISSGWQSFSSEFCCFAIWLEIVKYSTLLSNYIHTNMISKHRLQVVSLHSFTSSGKVCYERCLNTFKGVTVSNGPLPVHCC